MRHTLKDSFWNSIEYVTYRQEKDEELLKFLVLFSLRNKSIYRFTIDKANRL
jgi:hypothetical protein